ncbi:MAG: hypothetical protein JWQ13_2405 [Ramlibacter sp.]|jgi:hypothetical protein|nr:hypothetical protein [Ramlibacter sp.]
MATRDENRMNDQDPRIKGDPAGAGQASDRQGDEATPGKGENQAGFIKDKEARTSDSYGNTRDAGEATGPGKS